MLNAPAPSSRSWFNVLLGVTALVVVVVLLSRSSSRPTQAANDTAAQTPVRSKTETGRAAGQAKSKKAPRPARQRAVDEDLAGEQVELPPPEAGDPHVVAVLSAASDESAKGTRALIDSLTSDNEVVVAEAANALVKRGAIEAIQPLSKIDLVSAAGSGLSIIDALGRLAAVAGPRDKQVAVDRLVAMLAEEKQRNAPETPGNLLQIYEALGHTKEAKAAPVLEAELLDESVPRAPKVVIVGALVEIGNAGSRPALETAQTQNASAKEADAFEEEIRQELVLAIAAALESL